MRSVEQRKITFINNRLLFLSLSDLFSGASDASCQDAASFNSSLWRILANSAKIMEFIFTSPNTEIPVLSGIVGSVLY